MEDDGGAVQRDVPDDSLFVLQVGPQLLDGEQPGRNSQLESRRRIPVAGRQTFDFELPDNRPLADQRPGVDLQGDPSAVDERIAAVEDPDLLGGEPQREAQPEPLYGDLQPEAFREGAQGFAPGQFLHGRDIEQAQAAEEQQNDCKHSPKGIFEEFFHDWPSLRNYPARYKKRAIKPIVRP